MRTKCRILDGSGWSKTFLRHSRRTMYCHCSLTCRTMSDDYIPSLTANELIQQDPRNNSAWNQRWFAIHRGKNDIALSLDVARTEADYAISGATLDPYNESPWRYLVGVLQEQCRRGSCDETSQRKLLAEYEGKAYALREVLSEANREPDTCSNLTSARIDLLEMIGDKDSLEKVRSRSRSAGLLSRCVIITTDSRGTQPISTRQRRCRRDLRLNSM